VLDAVREHFTPAEAVELVLDVMRNSWNKTTVAAELDEAHVTEGVEVYEYYDDGTMEFGLAVESSPLSSPSMSVTARATSRSRAAITSA